MIIHKFKNILIKFLAKYRILLYRTLSTQKIEGDVRLIQPAQVLGPGRIIVDENVKIGFFPSPHFFSTYAYLEARTNRSLIKIGKNTHINNGFVAIAEKTEIVIGHNCLIGTCVEMYDSDFHALSSIDRKNGVEHISKCVQIGDNVFIGSNVKILKGVTIGDGAVVANGSIVTKDIPGNYIAAGIPAAAIRRIDNAK